MAKRSRWQRWVNGCPFGNRHRPLGLQGEAYAARFLRRRGYRILVRGYRDALGELDLVALLGRTVVFVEVKTRRSERRGHPADAVDTAKQRRLTRLALSFLRRHDLLELDARFDVIAILWPRASRKPAYVAHYENAFPAVGEGHMH